MGRKVSELMRSYREYLLQLSVKQVSRMKLILLIVAPLTRKSFVKAKQRGYITRTL
jgi:hypothetical protein